MYVIKRNGEQEDVSFTKISNRISKLCCDLYEDVSTDEVARVVISGLFDGVSTEQLDRLAAETAAAKMLVNPDYGKLASRLVISNIHKNTSKSFYATTKTLYENIDQKTGEQAPLVSEEHFNLVRDNRKELEEMINYEKDFNYSYFGINTLMKSYLIQSQGKIIERPQQLIMRVAVGIWKDNLSEVKKTYNMMSDMLFTHATPTLFNAGTKRPQLSSCFLLMNKEDSLNGIMSTKWDVARISSLAGGIGLAIHNVRAFGSYIKGSGGTSKGLLPLLKTYNEEARYWDQCFSGESLVRRPNGLIPFSEIEIGEILLSSDNKANKVREVKEFILKDVTMYSFTVNGITTEVTAEHPIMIIKAASNLEDTEIQKGLKSGALIPEWVEAFEIKENDVILGLILSDTKFCKLCDTVKNIDCYHNNLTSKITPYCISCSRESEREWEKTPGGRKAKRKYTSGINEKIAIQKYRSSEKDNLKKGNKYEA